MHFDILRRQDELFRVDMVATHKSLQEEIEISKFLVLGGGGTIGQAVAKEIFEHNPLVLHVIDQNENSLVELARDIRNESGKNEIDFRTFVIDIGSIEFDAFIKNNQGYDYVLNLAALKHVRSEKDQYTLMRMINVNVFYALKTLRQSRSLGAKKYFCVSTDKATNPINLMGATKRLMELFMLQEMQDVCVSSARFANVAFSDGSLLHSFTQRILKGQPLTMPDDIQRYFMTPKEAGQLCLLSCILGENGDLFYPLISQNGLRLQNFVDLATRLLSNHGLIPKWCSTEEEARLMSRTRAKNDPWPCLISSTNTTGEKVSEEFFSESQSPDLERFSSIGVIKHEETPIGLNQALAEFERSFLQLRNCQEWTKTDLVSLFEKVVPEFKYKDNHKYLDSKM